MRAEGKTITTQVGQFIKQYYSQWSSIPPELILERPLKEAQLIEEYLKEPHRRPESPYMFPRGPKESSFRYGRKRYGRDE